MTPENPDALATVVALFEFEAEANRAVDQLVEHGFLREQIGVITGHELSRPEEYVVPIEEPEGKLMDGVGKGMAYGGGIGAVAGGLSALLVPVVGPLVLAGALATTFVGAGLGASVGGVMAGLMKAGVDESNARLFEAALRHGGVVVTVHTAQARASEVVRILDKGGALDMDKHRLGQTDES